MQAINLMFGETDQIVHILGLDRDKIAAGIAAKYQSLLPFLQETANASPYAAAGDFGYAFLEKFIQLPFHLPHVTDREVQRFLANLNGEAEAHENRRSDTAIAGVLFETKVDSPLVKSIVSKMAAPLEYNPRRIKQFVNQFRLSAIIGTATGLFAERNLDPEVEGNELRPLSPEALGKLLVISLRWPRLLDDARKSPELLEYMEKMATTNNSSMLKVEEYDSVRELGNRWYDNPGVRSLVNAGLDDSGDRYSLAKIDLERFLQIAPAMPRASRTPEVPVAS